MVLPADPLKTFGTLETEQGITLRAFSGMLDGQWFVEGFVPPMFDAAKRAAVEVPGEKHVKSLIGDKPARRAASAALMREIHDCYTVPSADGREAPLRTLFDGEPPAGAGDCAGAKLLAYAYRHGLTPKRLLEDKPPCKPRCGPIFRYMLGLRIVFEDDDVIVLDKPAGQLSVPGKVQFDSLLTRLRLLHPQALLAHRLDQDTSGLLIAGKHKAAYVDLQRQFCRRDVDKTYVAILDRQIEGSGVIDLPMRVDVDDRPRQIVDHVHGKPARTRYEVCGERVIFRPETGRTHQIRVHAASGLGAPIKGDRLYGRADVRMFLHASTLTVRLPSGVRRFESPSPF